jgi:hypothetical protein
MKRYWWKVYRSEILGVSECGSCIGHFACEDSLTTTQQAKALFGNGPDDNIAVVPYRSAGRAIEATL